MDISKNINSPLRPQITGDGLLIPPTPNLKCLGYGTGVNVWALSNAGRSPWAIKNVPKTRKTPHDKNLRVQKLIENEAVILADINHQNIIGFRGLLKSIDGRQCLAMEQCGTSLGDLIEERREIGFPFSPQQIETVLRSIGKALNYLHVEKRLLHGDIKSYNILVKGDFEAVKLCDFGVSLKLDENGYAQDYTGTELYNAPEVIAEEEYITEKCEIFSLGLVIWQMIVLKTPHCPDIDTDDTLMGAEFSDESVMSGESGESSFLEKIPFGTRPALPPTIGTEYNHLINIFMACTEASPSDRPTAAEVVSMVDKIL